MDITNIVSNARLPKELITIVISMLPVLELRGALPIAVSIFGFSIPKAYILSVIGNIIPVLPFIVFLEKFSHYLMRYKIFDKFFTWWFNRTRKHSDLIDRFEALGLMLFVAVPLPVTGAWTASVAAYLFGVKKRHAIPSIILGVMIAGIIVSIITLGVNGVT
ncbi:COG2426 family protein [bacterium]